MYVCMYVCIYIIYMYRPCCAMYVCMCKTACYKTPCLGFSTEQEEAARDDSPCTYTHTRTLIYNTQTAHTYPLAKTIQKWISDCGIEVGQEN